MPAKKITVMGALDCLTIRVNYFYLPWPKNEKIWKKIDFGPKSGGPSGKW